VNAKKSICYLILVLTMLHTILTLLGFFQDYDKEVAQQIAHLYTPALTAVMVALTLFGTDPPLFLLAIGISVIFKRNGFKTEATFVMAAAALGRIVGTLSKLTFHIPRPLLVWPLPWPLEAPITNAYPSGHALMATVVFGAITVIYYRRVPEVKSRIILTGLCGTFIASIGFSRVYLGVHWINDIIGGYLYGASVLITCARICIPGKIRAGAS
jgi:membrane-associated phospholipid phosphatase